MSAPLTESFNDVVNSINSETKTLRCLSNLRGVTANKSNEVSVRIEEIAAIVSTLEQRFADMEALVDSEVSCLDMLNDLFEKSTQQNHIIDSLVKEM